jgi:hypothetical protein
LKKDGCEIQIDDRIGKITVKGSQTQIQRLKVQIQDIVGRFGERSLNQKKFSLLRTREGLSQVKTLFSTENESVVILVNDQGNVMLYGLDKATVQQACDTIENALEELKLPSSESAFPSPYWSVWKHFKTGIVFVGFLNETGLGFVALPNFKNTTIGNTIAPWSISSHIFLLQ